MGYFLQHSRLSKRPFFLLAGSSGWLLTLELHVLLCCVVPRHDPDETYDCPFFAHLLSELMTSLVVMFDFAPPRELFLPPNLCLPTPSIPRSGGGDFALQAQVPLIEKAPHQHSSPTFPPSGPCPTTTPPRFLKVHLVKRVLSLGRRLRAFFQLTLRRRCLSYCFIFFLFRIALPTNLRLVGLLD